jgi:predicted AlkP superfamily pyrophosphatase or phosphodiesterase
MVLLLCCAAELFGAAQVARAAAPGRKLLVVSVDGLDWRYLRDRDAMGLKIPNMRRLLAEGAAAQGVVGVWPTVTWPSHTSIITGVRPDQHGILGNQRPKSEGGDYYWTSDFLHAPTLWQCASAHGLTTASVTWPVTTGAAITWDLPEYFKRRNGGSMDLASIAEKATPGLVAEISAAYPSFPQQWVDDRTRTQAALYLLAAKKPDLILLHLVDLDSEEHDQGPFTQNARAILERTDELIGQMMRALPQGYDLALVSDHGFERLDHVVNLQRLLEEAKAPGEVEAHGGLAVTDDPKVAAFLREASKTPGSDIGREIPASELTRYAPSLAGKLAAFEPADHVMFSSAPSGAVRSPPREKGEHGFWPARPDYRSVYVLWGPGVRPRALPELQMLDLHGRLAAALGLTCPTP